MRELVFLRSADLDIERAFDFYEGCQCGRGEIVMRHLDATFGQLPSDPESAPVFHAPHRRLLVSGFPYGVFYALEGGRVIVSGVMDLRRDPAWIRRKLRGDDV